MTIAPANLFSLSIGTAKTVRAPANVASHPRSAVRSGHRSTSNQCPLYPSKQTLIDRIEKSAFPATRCFYRIIATVSPREVSMKRPAAIATGAALLLACALAAQAQEKVSEGVVNWPARGHGEYLRGYYRR